MRASKQEPEIVETLTLLKQRCLRSTALFMSFVLLSHFTPTVVHAWSPHSKIIWGSCVLANGSQHVFLVSESGGVLAREPRDQQNRRKQEVPAKAKKMTSASLLLPRGILCMDFF